MTTRLVLVRHAKSDYPPGVVDHDRPLNERGRRDAPQIGGWLVEHLGDAGRVQVVVSSAVRAQQTWELAAAAVPGWAAQTDGRIYEASPATLREVAADRSEADVVILVGHNPGLQRLVAELSAPGVKRSEALDRFPTSAVAVLETDEPWGQALESVASFSVSSFVIPRGAGRRGRQQTRSPHE